MARCDFQKAGNMPYPQPLLVTTTHEAPPKRYLQANTFKSPARNGGVLFYNAIFNLRHRAFKILLARWGGANCCNPLNTAVWAAVKSGTKPKISM